MIKQIETDGFIDPRDGKAYKTVKIGEQTWLAENLNWEGVGVWYNNSSAFGGLYGRLYTWEEALKSVPLGWHLPTDEEWQKLVDFAGGNEVAGEKFRGGGNGTDPFGFSALPGGLRDCNGCFFNVGIVGLWWSATEKDNEYAYEWEMLCGDGKVFRGDKACKGTFYKNYSLSVRLVQD